MRKVFVFAVAVLGFVVCLVGFHLREQRRTVPHGLALSWSGNERAIPKLQQELKSEPDNPAWNSALGLAYLQKARETGDPSYYSQADQLFDHALAAKPKDIEAIVGKASLAMSRHEFQMARQYAEQAIGLNPDVAMTYGVLTDAFVELGDYDNAIQTLQRMVRMKPNLSSYSRISYLRELNGDLDGAIQTMQMAVDAGAPDAENTAWCMVQLGNLYVLTGRLADADREFRFALSRFPNYVHAYAGLAKLAVVQKDYVAAAHYYQKAIDGVPLPEFVIGLGDVYEHVGKSAEAQAQFALVRTIEKLYRSNGVNMDLEMVLFELDHGGNVNEALKTIQVEWNRRKSVKVADAYAWALYRAGKPTQAREMVKQALRLGSKDPMLLGHARTINGVS
jgi:tetratricopeptide (TPR) repeat protein